MCVGGRQALVGTPMCVWGGRPDFSQFFLHALQSKPSTVNSDVTNQLAGLERFVVSQVYCNYN